MTSDERPPLPGSGRYAARGVRPTGTPDPAALIDLTVVLRRGQPLPAIGADPDDAAAARLALAAEGLEVLDVDLPSRRIQARGDVATLERVFGTSLSEVESPDPVTGRPVPHRQRTGELVLPASLAGVVIAVLGLDDRPQARARFRPAAGPTTSFSPLDLGRVYRFPAGTDGSGQTLAILELGGGYRQADLDAYWAQIGLADPPAIIAVGIDGVTNATVVDTNVAFS
jgi:kumamolisin